MLYGSKSSPPHFLGYKGGKRMLTYRGQYRILFEVDKQGKPAEFSFIPCRIKRNSSIYRHNSTTLGAYVVGKYTINKLIGLPELFKPFQVGDSEASFLFPERLLPEAAAILRPYVKGAALSPKPRRKIAVSDERKQELADRMRKLHANKVLLE